MRKPLGLIDAAHTPMRREGTNTAAERSAHPPSYLFELCSPRIEAWFLSHSMIAALCIFFSRSAGVAVPFPPFVLLYISNVFLHINEESVFEHRLSLSAWCAVCSPFTTIVSRWHSSELLTHTVPVPTESTERRSERCAARWARRTANRYTQVIRFNKWKHLCGWFLFKCQSHTCVAYSH